MIPNEVPVSHVRLHKVFFTYFWSNGITLRPKAQRAKACPPPPVGPYGMEAGAGFLPVVFRLTINPSNMRGVYGW